jgi:acetyl-CoA carboxylase biotin carboxyl carrier protein
MDINEIKKLLKVFDNSTATEMEIDETGMGGAKIWLAKTMMLPEGMPMTSMPQMHMNIPAQQAVSLSSDESEEPKTEKSKEAPRSENTYEVKAPMVGTFYRAPSPDADSYVKVGDIISQGTVLCIIEAMKLMNEIEAEVSGKIVKILVENAQAVEYNQPLFLIEKS